MQSEEYGCAVYCTLHVLYFFIVITFKCVTDLILFRNQNLKYLFWYADYIQNIFHSGWVYIPWSINNLHFWCRSAHFWGAKTIKSIPVLLYWLDSIDLSFFAFTTTWNLDIYVCCHLAASRNTLQFCYLLKIVMFGPQMYKWDPRPHVMASSATELKLGCFFLVLTDHTHKNKCKTNASSIFDGHAAFYAC